MESLKKIERNKDVNLDDICNVNQGIVSGADKVTKDMLERKMNEKDIRKYGISLEQGIFVLSKTEAEALDFIGLEALKPMYKNSDIQRYSAKKETDKYILYLEDGCLEGEAKKEILLSHLIKYKGVLDLRRETANGVRAWYALQWPRTKKMFEGKKIVVPHRAKLNKFAFVDFPWFASADVYFITERKSSLDWFFLLAQLNSKIMYFWLYNRGKRKGDDLELYASPLKGLPILTKIDSHIQKEIQHYTKTMVENGIEHRNSQNHIDLLLYKAYGLSDEEVIAIEELFQRTT